MKLAPAALKKLELDEDLREVLETARAIVSLPARRRAERALAGELRRIDLAEIDDKLAKVHESSNLDASQFHAAEHWRARMIDEGLAGAAEFPGGTDEQLPRLIEAAQRERTTGRPPGAARSLFRHIVERLKARPAG